MKKSASFAAGTLASLTLIAIGISVAPAIAKSPAPAAKSSAVGRPASPAKARVQAPPGVSKADIRALRSGVNATALSSGECTRLGGEVRGIFISNVCAATKRVCLTKDKDGNPHLVCINEK